MKKWTAVEYDLSKKLTDAVQPKRVKIENGMKLQLVIELDDKLFAKLSKDPTWLQKMQTKANEKAKPAMDQIIVDVKKADDKAGAFDEKTAKIFSNDLATSVKKKMDAAGGEMAKECDKLFEDYKKGQHDLMVFRIKSSGKITLSSISIVGHVAVAAASHGAHAPLAVVAIVRNAAQISQECVKLFLSADQFAKVVQVEIVALQKFMIENMDKASKAQKAGQAAKEIGLNLISGILGIETPSLKNCEHHIEVHKLDIGKLEKQSHSLSETIYKAMDTEEKWRKEFDAKKGGLPADKVGKIVMQREKAEKALDKLIQATIKVNEGIQRAQVRQHKFEEALDAMKKGVPAWTGLAKQVGGLGVDIGMSMGDVTNAFETVVEVVQEVEKNIADFVVEKV